MSNLLEIRDSGVTIVELDGKDEIVLVAVSLYNLMKNIPQLEVLVAQLMSGRIDVKDLGVETRVDSIPKGADMEKFLRKIKGQAPAKVDDVPDFVKRSLDQLKDDK